MLIEPIDYRRKYLHCYKLGVAAVGIYGNNDCFITKDVPKENDTEIFEIKHSKTI